MNQVSPRHHFARATAVAALLVVLAACGGKNGSASTAAGPAGNVGPYALNMSDPTDPHNKDAHWHAALGVYDCDHWVGDPDASGVWAWPVVTSNGAPGRADAHDTYAGLHSHGDGLIHMEPATAEDAGMNATVGRYFEYGGWKLSADSVTFLGMNKKNGDLCDNKPGKLTWAVAKWDGTTGRQKFTVKTGDPAAYKLYNDDIVLIAFVPEGTSITSLGNPPSTANLAGAEHREGQSTGTTPTPTTPPTYTNAAGKPCVAVKGPLPKGAPSVPVTVGPPPTKLVVRDLLPGTGPVVTNSSKVTVDYIGVACSTGEVFDSSYSRGQSFDADMSGGLIEGWLQGIPGMKVGGQRLLGIPADLAYGAEGAPPTIGPNEALWFVVTVDALR